MSSTSLGLGSQPAGVPKDCRIIRVKGWNQRMQNDADLEAKASLAVAHMLEIMLGPSRDAHYDLASGPFPLVSLAWL